MTQFQFKDAFIGYSREDLEIAEKLSKRIRHYTPPASSGLNKRKLLVFRDMEVLTAASDLSEELKKHIRLSKRLILLCSPDSAASKWVDLEVKAFLEKSAYEDIIIVLCRGALEDCLPPSLKGMENMPLYVDIKKNFRNESLRLIAALYQVDFMTLKREDEARRRKITWLTAVVSLVFIFVIVSFYIISGIDPVFWNRIYQPVASGSTRTVKMLPVHDIVIRKHNPSDVLFLGRNAGWFSGRPLYSLKPDSMPAAFHAHALDSLALSSLKDKEDIILVASIDFNTFDENDDLMGTGKVTIHSVLDDKDRPAYLRSMSYRAASATVNPENTITLSPMLLKQGEHPLDLGRLIIPLVERDFVNSEYRLDGTVTNILTGLKTPIKYFLDTDDNLAEGYTSWSQIWGEEYWILSNNRDDYEVLGKKLKDVRHDLLFWSKVLASDEWMAYQEPVQKHLGLYLILADGKAGMVRKISLAIPDIKHSTLLEKLLIESDIWDEDFIEATLFSVHSGQNKTTVVRIQEQANMPHDVPENVSVTWIVQFGANGKWKVMDFPGERVIGLWPLNDTGTNALMLSADLGFYLTNNGGISWTPANFNENGFADGSKVKPFVLDQDNIYALIDRGHSDTDGENPLYRLEKRNWIGRWRQGVIQLLQ